MEHKCFVQLGKAKNPEWINCKLLEKLPDHTFLVECHGQKLVVERVKEYKKIKYNFEKQEFSEVEEFVNRNWEEMKNVLSDAVSKFFPNEKLVIDEKEKIIYAMDNSVSIGGSVFEVESIARFQDVSQWNIVRYKPIYATRYEPEDVDEINVGHSVNNIFAAKIFIDEMWRLNCEGYWENKSYEIFADEFENV
mgnify:CR=1 FL=1